MLPANPPPSPAGVIVDFPTINPPVEPNSPANSLNDFHNLLIFDQRPRFLQHVVSFEI